MGIEKLASYPRAAMARIRGVAKERLGFEGEIGGENVVLQRVSVNRWQSLTA